MTQEDARPAGSYYVGPSDLTLIVVGPDQQEFVVSNLPPETSVRQVALQVLAEYGPASEARNLRFVVDLEYPEGAAQRVDPDRTFEQLNIDSTFAGKLRLSAEATAGGGLELIDMATFLGVAAVSGVAGNAAYDLLKKALGAVKGVRKRRRLEDDAVLDVATAFSIAQAFCFLKFNLRKLEDLKFRYAELYPIDSDARLEHWKIAMWNAESGRIIQIRIEVQDGRIALLY